MQPIPVKVKNVNVYPYIQWNGGGVGPVIPPVLEGASGTYAVGTLIRSVFYNLDLSGGKSNAPLEVHKQYVAIGQTEDGQSFTTPWMYCTEADKTPKFGRTITMIQSADAPVAESGSISAPQYITLGALTNITVSQPFPPPAIGQIMLIENGVGNIIATRTGTPHEMGVEVISGKRVSPLKPGMRNIMITGTNKDGNRISFGNLTCVSAGEPAVFLQQLV